MEEPSAEAPEAGGAAADPGDGGARRTRRSNPHSVLGRGVEATRPALFEPRVRRDATRFHARDMRDRAMIALIRPRRSLTAVSTTAPHHSVHPPPEIMVRDVHWVTLNGMLGLLCQF